jgi:UDP-3-O-[3-hydroxymyristoyl] glucosamine N-acyltransferase
MENAVWRRNAARMKQLDDLAKRIARLEKLNK